MEEAELEDLECVLDSELAKEIRSLPKRGIPEADAPEARACLA